MQLPYSNTKIHHWNPGATMPLVLPVHLICNTADEEIYANIRANSRRPGHWVNIRPEHGGVAVLCGSGPSLEDTLEEVRQWQAQGATVFAMNGAAAFLNRHGILADYQLLIDARLQTADLVGPAREHLFASQVHPECFNRAPSAQVWHLQVEGIENLFPDYERGYCLIGGAASVGNTATCLAYAMGYRNLQLYGYDSCHRDGKGHAFAQPMNDGDPCASVRFKGKDYIASLTMKLQAEKFMETSLALKKAGARIEVHGSGLLPDMYNIPPEPTEAEKYAHLWCFDEYRSVAPGEYCVQTFLDRVKPTSKVIDFGCGTGRAGVKLKEAGLDVLLVDFTENSRDLEAMALPFLLHDLTQPIPAFATYGFCADVMEHIPPPDVARVAANIMAAAGMVFFQISTEPDVLGDLIGQTLHLSVHPAQWWRELFISIGCRVTWNEGSMFIVQRSVS